MHCYFSITIGGAPAGTLVFKLYDDVVPKTAANFLSLCVGNKGVGKLGRPLHYKGSIFHRIIKGFMCQVIFDQMYIKLNTITLFCSGSERGAISQL